jgi:hypothetical protein
MKEGPTATQAPTCPDGNPCPKRPENSTNLQKKSDDVGLHPMELELELIGMAERANWFHGISVGKIVHRRGNNSRDCFNSNDGEEREHPRLSQNSALTKSHKHGITG